MHVGRGLGKAFGSRGFKKFFCCSSWKTLDKGRLKFEYLQFLNALTVRFVLARRVFWLS